MSRSKKKVKINKALSKIKLKNSTRFSLVVLSCAFFAFFSVNFFRSFSVNSSTKKEDIYVYKNIYNSDYTVNIIGNSFVSESSLPSGQTYVSDLVKSIDMNINYKYDGSISSKIDYDYKIDAIITAKYTSNGKDYNVWNKNYNLVTKDDQHSDNGININENISIDYQKYNQEVKNFKQSFGMTIDALLYVKLTVNTSTTINNEEVKNQYTSNFSVTIGDKIAVVDGKNSDIKTDSIKHESTVDNTKVDIFKLVISAIAMILSFYIIYFVRFKTKKLNTIRNEYKYELNRILKSCQDRIVIVRNNDISNTDTIIEVNDFGELIKLSEELFKPILCWMSNDINDEQAWFYVISNKVTYRFILK